MILDTNALSAWADGDAAVEASAMLADRPVVPVVVLGEHLFGIRQSRHRSRYEAWLRRTLALVRIANSDSGTADSYATILLELTACGETRVSAESGQFSRWGRGARLTRRVREEPPTGRTGPRVFRPKRNAERRKAPVLPVGGRFRRDASPLEPPPGELGRLGFATGC